MINERGACLSYWNDWFRQNISSIRPNRIPEYSAVLYDNDVTEESSLIKKLNTNLKWLIEHDFIEDDSDDVIEYLKGQNNLLLSDEQIVPTKVPQSRRKTRVVTKGEKFIDDGVYIGVLVNGKANGHGKWTGTDDSVYEGDWKDDKRNGYGKYIDAGGSVYVGEWKDDKMAGRGKMNYIKGDIYDGDWIDDNRSGHGKMMYASGNVYEGEWKYDMKNGRGKYNYENGFIEEGMWEYNEYMGK